jgi:hypothetical protein
MAARQHDVDTRKASFGCDSSSMAIVDHTSASFGDKLDMRLDLV